MKTNLAFIASLERSGSTILDLTLGSHDKIVSFGEVERVLMPHGANLENVLNRPCNCGVLVKHCLFWSNVIDRIVKDPQATTLSTRYKHFISEFQTQYGENKIAIDSSKNIRAMAAIAHASNNEVSILHTVRDVRAWTYSVQRAGGGKSEMPWNKILSPEIKKHWRAFIRHRILRSIPGWLMNEWAIRNKIIEKSIQNTPQLESINISYESLCLRPHQTLNLITRFLDISDFKGPPDINKLESHIVRGNRTAFQKTLLFPPRYDYEWLTSYKSSFLFSVFPNLNKLNKKWVYSMQTEAFTTST